MLSWIWTILLLILTIGFKSPATCLASHLAIMNMSQTEHLWGHCGYPEYHKVCVGTLVVPSLSTAKLSGPTIWFSKSLFACLRWSLMDRGPTNSGRLLLECLQKKLFIMLLQKKVDIYTYNYIYIYDCPFPISETSAWRTHGCGNHIPPSPTTNIMVAALLTSATFPTAGPCTSLLPSGKCKFSTRPHVHFENILHVCYLNYVLMLLKVSQF